jgi:hypothetical protein
MKGTGSIGDGDTGNTGLPSFQAGMPPVVNNDCQDDMTAETTFTPCRSLFRIGRHFPSFRESRPLKDDAVMYKAPSGYELGLYYYSDIF